MCGRYTLTSPAQQIAELFGVLVPAVSWVSRYNIAPGTEIPVVRASAEGGRQLDSLHWGLAPSWMAERPTRRPMINARSETVAEKPSFRSAFRKRRCLVPADGFYEWQKGPGGKKPYLMRRPDHAPFALAGLWEHWEDGAGETLTSCALLTTTPNGQMEAIHDRMPVVLAPEAWASWLDTETSPDKLSPLLVPVADDYFSAKAVTTRVNSPRYDDPLCLEPAGSLAALPSGTQAGLF
jgi:putative SOS response-associated peptidase YedK